MRCLQYQKCGPLNNCLLQVFEWPTNQWTDVRMVSAEIVMEERVEQWVHSVIFILPFSLLRQGQIIHCWISRGTVHGSSWRLSGLTSLNITIQPFLIRGKNVRFWFTILELSRQYLNVHMCDGLCARDISPHQVVGCWKLISEDLFSSHLTFP